MNIELTILTAGFPYGTSETFLETEINYLSFAFEKVNIIAINPTDKLMRSIPQNCTVEIINIHLSKVNKTLGLGNLLNPIVIKEIIRVKRVYGLRLTPSILKTILISFQKGKLIKKRIVSKTNISSRQVFYSYWCDDAAIGISLLKKHYRAIKTISRCHGWDVYFNVHEINYLPFRHFILSHLDAIAPISDFGADYIKNNWLVKNTDKKIRVMRLGVAREIKQSNKKDQSIFSIVSCSNVIEIKRVDLIVEALSIIEDIEINWIHFGDGNLLLKVKSLAKSKLKDNISVEFRGRVSNQEILSYYEKNLPSVFINVSSSEGIPVSIMEAMSFGIPVIATNVGGTSEIVNNDNGFLVPSEVSIKELSEFILKMFQTEIRELKAISAFNTWEEKYDANMNYKEFTQFLQRL